MGQRGAGGERWLRADSGVEQADPTAEPGQPCCCLHRERSLPLPSTTAAGRVHYSTAQREMVQSNGTNDIYLSYLIQCSDTKKNESFYQSPLGNFVSNSSKTKQCTVYQEYLFKSQRFNKKS